MSLKYRIIADSLRTEIEANGVCGERLPTEAALMHRFGVSRQTVRQALRVLLSEGMIEKRQGSGSYIAQTTPGFAAARHQIAILTPSSDNDAFPAMLQDIQSIFSGAGYHSQVFSTEHQIGQERAILESLLAHPVSGLLAEGTRTAFPNPNLDLYRRLAGQGTVIVFYGNGYPELPEFPCVRPDDFAGGYRITTHLLRERHTRIAGLFRSDELCGLQRWYGCACALRDHGLPVRDPQFFWYDARQRAGFSGPFDPPALENFIERQLAGCTAAVCQDDEAAYFLIRTLQSMGIRVPEQISVTGFGNSSFGDLGPVRITTLSHGGARLWEVAARGLLQLASHEPFSPLPFSWELQKKDSDLALP